MNQPNARLNCTIMEGPTTLHCTDTLQVHKIVKGLPVCEGARSWLALQTRLVRDFNNGDLMKYHEPIPETDILALIVHKLICS